MSVYAHIYMFMYTHRHIIMVLGPWPNSTVGAVPSLLHSICPRYESDVLEGLPEETKNIENGFSIYSWTTAGCGSFVAPVLGLKAVCLQHPLTKTSRSSQSLPPGTHESWCGVDVPAPRSPFAERLYLATVTRGFTAVTIPSRVWAPGSLPERQQTLPGAAACTPGLGFQSG